MSDRKPHFILNAQGKWVIEEKPSEFEKLFSRVDMVLQDTLTIIKPVLKAGGGFDKPALRHLVFTTLLDQMSHFSKDELHMLLVSVFADRIMADIESRPWGDDKPDLLSGK